MRGFGAAVKELGAAVLILIVARDAGGLAAMALAVLILAAVFLLSRWRWPYKPCRKCEGTGRNTGSNGRRHGDCKRCKGARRVQRSGARTVHRVLLSIRNHVRDSKEKDHV